MGGDDDPDTGRDVAALRLFRDLRRVGEQIRVVESQVVEVRQALSAQQMTRGRARDLFAQLEARLERLQCDGVDAVPTSALGGSEAKDFKKGLLKVVERLHDELDGAFQSLE